MFLRWYRKNIAQLVENKMGYLGTCANEIDMILHIIAPKDYKRFSKSHCKTDCWCKDCKSYEVKESKQ